jgi:hypothetical protein
MAILALTLVRSAQILLLWLFLSDVSHSSYGAKMSQSFKMPIPSTNICLNDYVFKDKFKSVYINFIHVFKTGGSSLRHLVGSLTSISFLFFTYVTCLRPISSVQ